MSTKSGRICPHCQNELSPSEITHCSQCGRPLKETVKLSASASVPPRDTIPTPKLEPRPIQPFPTQPHNQQRRKPPRWLFVFAVVLAILVILFFALIHTTLGAQKTPTPKTTPAPTAIPMVRVTISLLDVICTTTQGIGHNQFYMVSSFSAPAADPKANAQTQSNITPPLSIDDEQYLPLPGSPVVVFDKTVPQGAQIKGGFMAFNDQHNLAWGNANIDTWIANITTGVATGLIANGITSGNFVALGAGVILGLAELAWYNTANINSSNSNELGKTSEVFSASGPTTPTQYGKLYFKNGGGAFGLGSWDYTVGYQITFSPANL